MANPCDPNAGEPIPGIGPIVVYDVAKLVNLAESKLVGWLTNYLPQIGGQSYDLSVFCAGDVPNPTTDAATIANFFNPLNPTGATELDAWLHQVVNRYLVWPTTCQCSSGSPVVLPPIAQPPTLTTQPPDTSNPAGTPCESGTIFGSNSNPGVGQGVQSYPFGTNFPLAGKNATLLVVTEAWSVVSGSFQFRIDYEYTDGSGANQKIGGRTISDVALGNTTYQFQLPAGVQNVSQVQSSWLGTGTVGYNNKFDVYCNGATPTGSPSQCCPTDPNLMGLLQQILSEVELIYSIIPVRVPNYAAGVSHTGLSDTGTISLASTTIAVRVTFDTLPHVYGSIAGVPVTLLSIGWITPVTNEGQSAGLRLSRDVQVVELPEATSALEYTFEPGASVTITELLAG